MRAAALSAAENDLSQAGTLASGIETPVVRAHTLIDLAEKSLNRGPAALDEAGRRLAQAEESAGDREMTWAGLARVWAGLDPERALAAARKIESPTVKTRALAWAALGSPRAGPQDLVFEETVRAALSGSESDSELERAGRLMSAGRIWAEDRPQWAVEMYDLAFKELMGRNDVAVSRNVK